jgi:HD domain-containing protein
MTVPGRIEAAAILLRLTPRPRLVRHSRGVAEVAGWLAARVVACGGTLDRRLAETGALLHDIDKALPSTWRDLPHGRGSAAWLADHGLDELAPVVADHPVTRLADRAWFEDWLATSPLEARIVAYADKRVAQRLGPMDDRFADWDRRYRRRSRPETERREIRARADRLERDVCAAAGCRPIDVRRLRWTAAAMRAATRMGAATGRSPAAPAGSPGLDAR